MRYLVATFAVLICSSIYDYRVAVERKQRVETLEETIEAKRALIKELTKELEQSLERCDYLQPGPGNGHPAAEK
jgi:cell division protein FtsL